MLAWMKTHTGGRLGASEVGRTWIWSDLHLDHAEVVWCFNRPFRTSQAMCRALVEAWRETVEESDRIICLGDVTVGAASRGIDNALASVPGTRVLVVGNHEFPVGGAGAAGRRHRPADDDRRHDRQRARVARQEARKAGGNGLRAACQIGTFRKGPVPGGGLPVSSRLRRRSRSR